MNKRWRNQSIPRFGVGVLLAAMILSNGLGGIEVSAQTLEAGVDRSAARSPWGLLRSKTSGQDRVLWAMWVLHMGAVGDGLSSTRLVGMVYRGGFAATFITTHGRRAYTMGLERKWVSGEWGPLAGMLGFRTGLIYGYDERLGWIAEKYPILPFVQPVVFGRVGPVGADLTYTWVTVSLTASLSFE